MVQKVLNVLLKPLMVLSGDGIRTRWEGGTPNLGPDTMVPKPVQNQAANVLSDTFTSNCCTFGPDGPSSPLR